MYKISIPSIEKIDEAAKKFLEAYKDKRIFAFYGEMGAGKTTFIIALCEQLLVTDVVTSPTFALINEYDTQKDYRVYHFDFYRISDISEVYDLGYDDYFNSGNYCLIEWPEKIEDLLPEEAVKVQINVLPNQEREIVFGS
jgi:tRNA threonylcarbamoyladenosine biosynthesis protein TsaE